MSCQENEVFAERILEQLEKGDFPREFVLLVKDALNDLDHEKIDLLFTVFQLGFRWGTLGDAVIKDVKVEP